MNTARNPRSAGRATLFVACLGLVVAACGPAASQASQGQAARESAVSAQPSVEPSARAIQSGATPWVPQEARDATDKRLAVVLDGETIYIRNGGQIILDDDLIAEIYLDPYPPSTLSSIMDVYLTRDGSPLADGGVEIAYEMLAMAHGPFSAEAKKIGGGHYLVPLDYIMFGPWEQVVTIRIGLQRIHLPILVVAYP